MTAKRNGGLVINAGEDRNGGVITFIARDTVLSWRVESDDLK